MMKSTTFILLAFISFCSAGLYEKTDDVVELTKQNFEESVVMSNDVYIVEFYSPGCGHCKKFAPEYKKLATALKGILKVGAVNTSENKSLGKFYEVKGVPTIKIFTGKMSIEYKGERTAQAIADVALAKAEEKVLKKLLTDNVEKCE